MNVYYRFERDPDVHDAALSSQRASTEGLNVVRLAASHLDIGWERIDIVAQDPDIQRGAWIEVGVAVADDEVATSLLSEMTHVAAEHGMRFVVTQ